MNLASIAVLGIVAGLLILSIVYSRRKGINEWHKFSIPEVFQPAFCVSYLSDLFLCDTVRLYPVKKCWTYVFRFLFVFRCSNPAEPVGY